ncbi:MAG: S26 family signal peptidase, partial [bacterium]|nr:S26 family signal peptidase [bacterium]
MQKGSWLRSNLEALGLAVALAIVLRIFVVQAFTIPSGSMIPTLLVG